MATNIFRGDYKFLPVVVDPGTESDPWDRETVTDMKYIDWERGYLTTTDQVQ